MFFRCFRGVRVHFVNRLAFSFLYSLLRPTIDVTSFSNKTLDQRAKTTFRLTLRRPLLRCRWNVVIVGGEILLQLWATLIIVRCSPVAGQATTCWAWADLLQHQHRGGASRRTVTLSARRQTFAQRSERWTSCGAVCHLASFRGELLILIFVYAK